MGKNRRSSCTRSPGEREDRARTGFSPSACRDPHKRPRMAELAVAVLGTIVRLGEALPVVLFSSAVDFILPVNCRRSTTAVRAASGTAGKMNSSEAEPRHAAPPARAACEGRLWPQQVDQTGVKACRRRAVVARAETAAEEPSAVASQRLPGPPSGSPCPF